MNKVLLRWLLPTLALLVFGPLIAWPVGLLRDGIGSADASLFLSNAPMLGVLAVALLIVVAGGGGAVTARLTAPGTGRTFVGLCAAWAMLRTGDSWDMLMAHGGGVVVPWTIEAIVVAGASVVLMVMLMLGGGSHDRGRLVEDFRAAMLGGKAATGILIGVVAGGIAAWLVAMDGGRGQALMGGVFGGVLAAVGVQLAAQDLSPDRARLRAWAAVLVLMVLSPLSLLVLPGAGAIADGARAGTLVGPGLVTPLAWVVGIFLGVPTGLSWVGSVAEKAHAKQVSVTGRA